MNQKIYYFQKLKIVKHLLNKLIEKQKTLEFKLSKARKTFQLNSPLSIQGSWMLGLTSLEV